jgi:predicted Zn finger-like uncharacterized protein
MALATICPHCNTTFRVASDQLKLRGGVVRCGACNEVFDGNAALVDLGATAPPAAAAPAAAAPLAPASAPPETPESDVTPSASAAFDAEMAAIDARPAAEAPAQEEPIYTLDFDTTFDPFGILPKSLQAEPAPAPEPEPPAVGADAVSGLQVEQFEQPDAPPPQAPAEPGSEPLPEPGSEPEREPDPSRAREASVDFQPPLLMRASASAQPALAPTPSPSPMPQVDAAKLARRNAARKRKAEPQAAEPVVVAPVAEPEPGEHEPEFVKISRRKQQTGRTRRLVLGLGSALLVLALAAQGVVTFRNVLAARYPQAKGVLAGACAVLGCKVELPAQIDALSVETGELQSLGANRFAFTTLLRNQTSLVQAWPYLELTLTDANDKPLVRRIFTPAEYLPPGVAPARGIAARSEQAVKLAFELNQVKASGYHIAIFYP